MKLQKQLTTRPHFPSLDSIFPKGARMGTFALTVAASALLFPSCTKEHEVTSAQGEAVTPKSRAGERSGKKSTTSRPSTPYSLIDTDADGVEDKNDKCPNTPEDRDGFQDDDGCPDPDNDGDGIPDIRDKCPNTPEDKNGIEDEDGCPDRKVRIRTAGVPVRVHRVHP